MHRPGSVPKLMLLLGVFLAACGRTAPPPAETPVLTQPSETQVEVADATLTSRPEPAATPTPTSSPPLAVLLAPPESDPALVEMLEDGLQPALAGAGLRWEVRQSLSPGAIAPDLKLVIVLPPDPGVSGLLTSAPGVQFLAVGLPGTQPGANLSVIGPQGFRPDQAGFIAGVMAALITSDWRVGILGPGDTPEARAARQGFLNGAIYFCGLCLPYHGPSVDYPIYQDLQRGADAPEIQAAAQALKDQSVETVYLPPEIPDPKVFEALTQAGINLIGSSAPPPAFADQWAATIIPDPLSAALDLLPDLLAGEGGLTREMVYSIRDVNPALLSDGRLALLQEIMADLRLGYIDTGIDPLSGEPR